MIDFAKYRLQIFITIAVFVLSATFLAIKFAQGYRLDFSTKSILPTGLLVASSNPKGAQVLVNGKLKTATDNTISLPPGEYEVEIKKAGFASWKKNLIIEKELVTQAEAFLFPQVPDLKPLTFASAENPQVSPDGTKLVYGIPLPSEEAGLWVMDLTDFLFNIGREPKQIVKSTTRDFAKAKYSWSLDSKQILVEFVKPAEKFLLDPGQLNSPQSLVNVAPSLSQIIDNWAKEENLRRQARLKKVPEEMQKILLSSTSSIDFSPDNTKILYLATASAQIPENLIPPVLVASTQPETRTLEPNKLYVYDVKEDKNFLIPLEVSITPTPSATPTPKTRQPAVPTPTPSLDSLLASPAGLPHWFPTSRHLYWIEGDKVVVCEYDYTNLTTIYSGPFIKPYVFAAPGANKLIILTQINLNPDTKPNLYSVSLR